MANEGRFFIPDKINVGYRERTDTYTGKLSYIIYWDKKGVLRKEKSWQSWRDTKIEPSEFENVPTDGFVLNKHVGGHKSDWNFRQSYCRIYDPRGFEFEITIDNLLWILDKVDCLAGKGLTGQFVYGWVGTDLVLLPCCSEEYKASQMISSNMVNKTIKTKELVPGAEYIISSGAGPRNYNLTLGKEVIFVGLLKFSKDYGLGFETKPVFVRAAYPDRVFVLNTSSILYKNRDDAMEKEEIDKIIDLFSENAYSYSFWHTPGSIKKFVKGRYQSIEEQNPYERWVENERNWREYSGGKINTDISEEEKRKKYEKYCKTYFEKRELSDFETSCFSDDVFDLKASGNLDDTEKIFHPFARIDTVKSSSSYYYFQSREYYISGHNLYRPVRIELTDQGELIVTKLVPNYPSVRGYYIDMKEKGFHVPYPYAMSTEEFNNLNNNIVCFSPRSYEDIEAIGYISRSGRTLWSLGWHSFQGREKGRYDTFIKL